mmetsp:Transcript_13574/g.25887  ORF Transcript_13574/g.25887 Transcript_13574/m.25887 type:complete len:263 (-) Transcript_13574:702-1490(-)
MSDAKHKIYVCEFWEKGRCHRGDTCSFVHAHVDPSKKGICQKHLQGLCRFTNKLCHYQHLSIPLELYEALSAETRSFAELANKIENANAEEKHGEEAVPDFTKIKQKEAKGPDNTVHMNRFPFETAIGSNKEEKLAVKSRLWSAFFQLHPKKPKSSLSIALESNTKEPSMLVEKENIPNLCVPVSKALRDWNCEEVASFIKLLGTAQIWHVHSRMFFENEIDGATLAHYGTAKDILQDFGSIHPAHARVISTAVRKKLQQPS